MWHMEIPRLGIESELQLLACAIAIATWDPSTSETYTTHSNARSLTYWARPEIKFTTSWFPVGFVSAAPWQELLQSFIFLLNSLTQYSSSFSLSLDLVFHEARQPSFQISLSFTQSNWTLKISSMRFWNVFFWYLSHELHLLVTPQKQLMFVYWGSRGNEFTGLMITLCFYN